MVDETSMKRRFLVPEVIQASATDCGPAALKALFGGFGVYLSYGRLREACQTDVDGTSIDTLEEIAQKLGLDASQTMLPADLLVLEELASLPAIVVVRLPDGALHFVVLWRVHGSFVQIMDPAAGRVWMERQRFLDSLYLHEQSVPRAACEEWLQSEAFTAALLRRMRDLGVEQEIWTDRLHLDASLRLAHTLVRAGKLKRGIESREFLTLCASNPGQIPPEFWSLRETEADTGQMQMRGAVLIAAAAVPTDALRADLPESLAAIRSELPPRVWSFVWSIVQEGGRHVPVMLGFALLLSAAGTVFEALLFRSLFQLTPHLQLMGQRMAAIAATIMFLSGLLGLEWAATAGLLRLGRQLEMRLRARFLWKVPRLNDGYFRSRLISDMAFRAHSLQLLRQLPELSGQLLRLAATLTVTAVAIAWLYPGTTLLALMAILVALGVPLLLQPALGERDLRVREMSGGLSRFYLDALLGSRPIHAHCAEQTMHVVQLHQLKQWAKAGLRQKSSLVFAEAVHMSLTLGLVICLICWQAVRTQNPAGLLLLIYWALSIPAAGRQFASIAWSLPAMRNTVLRLLEPLGAQEEQVTTLSAPLKPEGIKVEIENVTVMAAGHVILDGINLSVAPGEHVGIVGLSGSGKSSLVGLLLGWHKPVQGSVRVDGVPLDADQVAQLRRATAWIDPQVQLFRKTLFDNVCYGNGDDAVERFDRAIEDAGVLNLLERLPEGLQTSLGEGGALVAGGEGQLIRISRALARPGVRLAILDEPAHGLDRGKRQSLLAKARQHFSNATLFCITHDVNSTLDFDRVLVVEQGRILEQGSPCVLYDKPGSRYWELCDQEKGVQRNMWSHPSWRRMRMSGGLLTELVEEREWTHV